MSSVGDDRPYYYRQRSRTLGPFDLKQIRFKAKSAHIGLSTPVSRDGLDWRTLADFPEVMVNVSPGPPIVQAGSQSLLPPPAVVAEWLYSIDGEQAGPVTAAEIEGLIRQGALSREHYVLKIGWQDWVSLGSVAEFAHVLAPPIEPPPTFIAHPAMAAAPATGGFVGGAFCSACGASIHAKTVICPKCGVGTGFGDSDVGGGRSGDRKDKLVAALLAFFLGVLGVHRFYLGDTLLGVLHLLTFGVCGIGAFIDFLIFLLMNQKDFDRKYNSGMR